MLFTSHVYFLVLLILLSVYWFSNRRIQNVLLLVTSVFFYSYWDWRFLALLGAVVIVNFVCALLLERTQRYRKLVLSVAIIFMIGLFSVFKYFDFFVENFILVWMQLTGRNGGFVTAGIILPIGLSFYLFQSASYVVDVYRRKIPAEKNLIDFAVFVSFFPQLVAGPIERAENLLKQIKAPRQLMIGSIRVGISLILLGLFKKLVIADNLGLFVNEISTAQPNHPPFSDEVILMTVAFGIQILADFSAYTDIARGTAKLLGINLSENFRIPYAALSIRDFWRRWHVTLSSWFRDYLYIPLGGNQNSIFRNCLNVMATMLLSGLWHGAGWNFVIWGAWHGLFICFELLLINCFWSKNMAHALLTENRMLIMLFKLITGFLSWGYAMVVIFIGWYFFLISSQRQASFLWESLTHFELSPDFSTHTLIWILASMVTMAIVDFLRFGLGNQLAIKVNKFGLASEFLKTSALIVLGSCSIILLQLFGAPESVDFIYFAF